MLDIGMVGHRDGLLRDRLTRARRRRLGDRLAQPEGLGRLQARARRGDRALGRRGDPGRAPPGRERGLLRRRRPRARSRSEDIYEEFHHHVLGFIEPERDPADGGRARRRQRDGRADDRADHRHVPDRRGPALLRAQRRVPRPRAEPAAGGEPQADHRHGARPRAPSSGSPGTATPTAASSSTTRASSCPATS